MYSVSKIKIDDKNEWEDLYKKYASFYSMDMPQATLDLVWSWIHDEAFPFYGLAAREADNHLIGIGHYRAMPSPLRGAMVGFLDDLYISPECRGGSAVRTIFDYLRLECRANGWLFMRWITKEDNYRARGAYEKIATKTEWVTYQMDL